MKNPIRLIITLTYLSSLAGCAFINKQVNTEARNTCLKLQHDMNYSQFFIEGTQFVFGAEGRTPYDDELAKEAVQIRESAQAVGMNLDNKTPGLLDIYQIMQKKAHIDYLKHDCDKVLNTKLSQTIDLSSEANTNTP
ncbi:MAG: hypothetical protein AAGF06_06880 [Pseudomonadota bacterium]